MVAICLEVGTRLPEEDKVIYSDIDLQVERRATGYAHKDGRPYPGTR